MDIEKIAGLFGNARALSELINLPAQTIYSWVRANKIPRWHIPAVKKAARKLGVNIEEYLK